MIQQILIDYPEKITNYTDENGFTLLHHAALISKDGKIKFLLDFARNHNGASDNEINHWVNAETNVHKWTALHFCSFTGHIDSAYALIDNYADIFAIN